MYNDFLLVINSYFYNNITYLMLVVTSYYYNDILLLFYSQSNYNK